jgi:hypothetical protein
MSGAGQQHRNRRGNPNTIYVVVRPSSGGAPAFRTTDGGTSWVNLSDALQAAYPGADPVAIAINPALPQHIYLATLSQMRFYFSDDRGDTWQQPLDAVSPSC